MPKLRKTRQELVDYMWEEYPDDDQLEIRTALLDAFDFLTGVKDTLEKERNKIKEQINEKLTKEIKFKLKQK